MYKAIAMLKVRTLQYLFMVVSAPITQKLRTLTTAYRSVNNWYIFRCSTNGTHWLHLTKLRSVRTNLGKGTLEKSPTPDNYRGGGRRTRKGGGGRLDKWTIIKRAKPPISPYIREKENTFPDNFFPSSSSSSSSSSSFPPTTCCWKREKTQSMQGGGRRW